jgi:putative PEP-CTERM system TPR-repeat lipoprotein
LLADLEARLGRPAEGLKIAGMLQRDYPNAPVGWVVEGDIQARGKQSAAALRAYERAYSIAPSGQLAVKLHAVHAQSGKVNEGERRLRQWLERTPSDDGVRLYLAESYLKAAKYKDASLEYEAFLGRRPDHIVALNNLAWCYQQLGDSRSMKTAETALSLKPEDSAVLDTLGWILIENKEYQRGVEFLQKAATKAANAPEIRYHYAVGLLKWGKRYRAKEELERLLLDFPKFPQHAQASKLLAELKTTGAY